MVPTKKPAIAAMHRRAFVVIFVVKTPGRATFGRLELPPGEGRFVLIPSKHVRTQLLSAIRAS